MNDMQNKIPKLSDLEGMARAAGEILRRNFGKVHQIDHKGVIDYVTETDRESERFLLAEIEGQFPGSSAQGEEGGRLAGSGKGMWYIDPIDGTMNFAHGLPIFSVSLAYEIDGELMHGVVYNPIHEELYSATKGNGAWLNGEAIQVSNVRELKDSLLVTGFPYDSWTNPKNNLSEHKKFTLLTQGVRRLGSAALDLCYVAAGRLDGFWEIRLNAWDVAAGALIVQEAGGKVSAIDGTADFMSAPQSILAANASLHIKMLAILQEK